MQSSHAAAAVSSVFDDPNLVAYGGLEPVIRLAERCALPTLADELIRLPCSKDGTGAFPAAKLMSLVGGMVRAPTASRTWTGYGTARWAVSSAGCGTHPRWGRSWFPSRTDMWSNCTPWPAGSCPNWPVTPRCCPARTTSPTRTSMTPSAAPTATPNKAPDTDTGQEFGAVHATTSKESRQAGVGAVTERVWMNPDGTPVVERRAE